MSGETQNIEANALIKSGFKLESAPVPIADAGAGTICYCPECGARLRAKPLEQSVKSHRSTIPGLDPLERFTPSPAQASEVDEEPTRVFHGLVEVAAAELDRSRVPVATSEHTHASPPVARQSNPSVDDEDDTVTTHRGEIPDVRPSSSMRASPTVIAAPSSPSIPLAVAHAVVAAPITNAYAANANTAVAAPSAHIAAPITNAFAANAHPQVIAAAPSAHIAAPSAHIAAAGPSALALSNRPAAQADASAAPAQGSPSTATVAPAPAALPPTVVIASASAQQTNTSIPPAVAASVADFDSPYASTLRKRKRSVVFPMLGLGLGVAAAVGLTFLMYGNTTSRGRGKPIAALEARDDVASGAVTTRILAANAAPGAAADAIAEPAPGASAAPSSVPESDPQSADSARAQRKIPEPAAARVSAKTDSEPRGASEGSEAASPKVASPATETKRAAAPASKIANAEAQAEEDGESDGPKFDSDAASAALDNAAQRASNCRQSTDPSGVARVTITFAPSGRVTTATIAGPPFVGTPTGSCIATVMRGASVPAFSGNSMTVHKTVTIM